MCVVMNGVPGRRVVTGAATALAFGASLAYCLSCGRAEERVGSRLEARARNLVPRVESALGHELPKPIRVSVSTREKIGALIADDAESLIQHVEGEVYVPGSDSRPRTWTVHGAFGFVDDAGFIHVAEEELEGRPRNDPVGEIADAVLGLPHPLSDEDIDRLLVHELVHLGQASSLGSAKYLRGAATLSDVLARSAVLEGHAEAVTAQLTGRPLFDSGGESDDARARLSFDAYASFELPNEARGIAFRYDAGREFIESALARFGRDETTRKLIAHPPSLADIWRPADWPERPASSFGTDEIRRAISPWLAREWKSSRAEPLPPPVFLAHVAIAPDAVRAAENSLLEVQRFEAMGWVGHSAMRSHLLAARDKSAAAALAKSWIAAARARDAFVSPNLEWRTGRVRESHWVTSSIDGAPVTVARRRYFTHTTGHVWEDAVVAQRGPFVVEVRLANDAGGAQAAVRLTRRMLANVQRDAQSDPRAPSWEARWRSASAPGSPTDRIRPLLDDKDADVRHAALLTLLRRRALRQDEVTRLRRDQDPLVRATAFVGRGPGDAPDPDAVMSAIEDPDPWVAASGWEAALLSKAEMPADSVLAKALLRPEPEVRRAASLCLSVWPRGTPAERVALVRRALADEDPAVRARAASALFHAPAGTPGLGEAISHALGSEDEDLRAGALRLLGVRIAVGEPVAGTTAALVALLDDPNSQKAAIEALGGLGAEGRGAIERLRRIAQQAEREGVLERRLDATAAIAAISADPSELARVLGQVLSSGSERDARSAVPYVARLRRDAVELLPAIETRLRSKDRELVIELLRVIARLGSDGAKALKSVEPLASSADPAVREAATRTVTALRPADEPPPDEEDDE